MRGDCTTYRPPVDFLFLGLVYTDSRVRANTLTLPPLSNTTTSSHHFTLIPTFVPLHHSLRIHISSSHHIRPILP
jgi:hypothetical protein